MYIYNTIYVYWLCLYIYTYTYFHNSYSNRTHLFMAYLIFVEKEKGSANSASQSD